MFKKLRYGIVICAAAIVLTAVLIITQSQKPEGKKAEAADEPFRVQDISAEMMGNTQKKAESAGGETPADISENDTADNMSDESVVPSSEASAEAAEPDTAEAEKLTETEASAETEALTETEAHSETGHICTDCCAEESLQAAEENIVPFSGLRKYFENNLVINPEKVSLYLNVREEPDEDSKILSVLYPRDISRVVGKNGDWYMIQCDGYIGYVSMDCVLIGDQAYEALKHNVAYAAMAKEDSVFLYNQPDTGSDVILAAAKSEFFRVVNAKGDFFEVSVTSPLYDTLYVRQEDVLLFYIYLGPGNDNELDEETELYFERMDISDNVKKAMGIQAEAESERASYESEEARLKEASIAAEMAYEQKRKEELAEKAEEAAEEAAGQDVKEEPQETTPGSEPQEEKHDPFSEAERTGEMQYLGTFTITGYCHCPKCCGIWGSNDPNYKAHGSSGMLLEEDYSVAVDVNQIPYGTRLMINGKTYIAADTGVGPNHIDIYHRLHSDAERVGMQLLEVYILP